MNRKKAFLAILLLCFVVAVVSSYFRMPRQKTVATLKYGPGSKATPRQTAATAKTVKGEEDRIRFELLDQAVPRFAGYKRNLFKPIFHEEIKVLPLPPPPPPKPKIPQPPSAQGGAASQGGAQKAAEPTPVQRDMSNFTFLGFLKKEGKKTIFLLSNKEIFLARQGDRLAGKYNVTKITDESLVISSISDGGEIIIPLVENKPLAAPASQKPASPPVAGSSGK